MATCNGEAFLEEQLYSIATQSLLPNELVVSDDASTDTSLEILKNFRASSPFLVKIRQNKINLGFIKNFELALGGCSGDIVLLSDQDDYWYPNKIQTVYDLLSSNPQILCNINNAIIANSDLTVLGKSKLHQIRLLQQPETAMVLGCCMALRRSALDYVIPFPDKIKAHDQWIAFMLDCLYCINRSDKVLQLYRQHERNLSNQLSSRLDLLDLSLVSEICRKFRKLRSNSSLQEEIQLNLLTLERLLKVNSRLYYLQADTIRKSLVDLVANLQKLTSRADQRSNSRFHRAAILFYKSFFIQKTFPCATDIKDILSDRFNNGDLLSSAQRLILDYYNYARNTFGSS